MLYGTLDDIIDCVGRENVLDVVVKKPTNADRIRAMSDGELAEFLDRIHSCSRCRRRGNDCFPHWDVEEWLKKPAEEV